MSYFVGENVVVSSDVVIASGVILEAAPKSLLVIEAGVCIGAGAILQAYGGELRLAAGVNVGRDVLLIGAGTIGTSACIGAESTLINPSIAARQVVSARSLLGSPEGSKSTSLPNQQTDVGANGHSPVSEAVSDSANASSDAVDSTDASLETMNGHGSLTSPMTVYGRDQVMRLVQTLFPHRAPLSSEASEPDAS